ncbi:MAG: inorganic phosphate transporter [Chloroflexi bacterium]|nr:inorganic phosphate transporter [Chloroflexota bacterium]
MELFGVVLIIAIALAFDFVNGMHDAANSIATVVATRVLRPQQAVLWAAFFNFVAAFGFGVEVAGTIGKGVIDASIVNEQVILSALVGAIVWDMITWYYGLPSSSSHALIGGLVGAALAESGRDAIINAGIQKVAVFIVVSPLLGFILGSLISLAIRTLFRNAHPSIAGATFKRLQLLSAGLYSLSHGTNDAQKTMGIITVLLFSTGYLDGDFRVPLWVILAAHTAIALGTMAGGWRIIHTMGSKLTKLEPYGGFSAESAAAASIIYASRVGIPVSTTHTIAGAIAGVGSTRRFSAVRWGVAGQIVWAWILTIPAAAALAALTRLALEPFA